MPPDPNNPQTFNRQQIEVRFLDSATKEPVQPNVFGNFDEISEAGNLYTLSVVEQGYTVIGNELDPNGRAIVVKYSNGTEMHIIPEPIH